MKTRRLLSLATTPVAIVVLSAAAYAASGASGAGAHSDVHRFSPNEALTAARRIATFDHAAIRIDDSPRFHSLYRIDSGPNHARVDAFTGVVTSVTLDLSVPTTPDVRISVDQARGKAEAFLRKSGVGMNDLEVAAQLVDHGAFKEFTVSWQRRIHGALVPDQRVVSVNPDTGDVFNLLNIAYEFQDPKAPTLTQGDAASIAAEEAEAPLDGLRTADLLVWFDDDGRQVLVWRFGFRIDDTVPSAVLVDVDAETGAASIIGRG